MCSPKLLAMLTTGGAKKGSATLTTAAPYGQQTPPVTPALFRRPVGFALVHKSPWPLHTSAQQALVDAGWPLQ